MANKTEYVVDFTIDASGAVESLKVIEKETGKAAKRHVTRESLAT